MIRRYQLSRTTVPLTKAAAIGVALVLAGTAVGSALPDGNAAVQAVAPPSLAKRLDPQTWALAIPVAWLSAPIRDLRVDDVIDLLGARAGAAGADFVAIGLRVVAAEESTLIVELTADDAAAIASARARGLALVPILRAPE